MYTVLIGIDDDEDRALAQAEAVLDLPEAGDRISVHLCHVFQDNPEGASVNQLSAIRRASERLEESGVTCQQYEASGDPSEELLAAADSVDADLICLSGRKRTPAGKAVFGSVTQKVILSGEYPVLTVPLQDE